MLAAGIVIALAISLIPNAGAGGPSGGGRDLEELGDIFDTAEATSLGGRAATWGGALELTTSWERFPEESGFRNAVRYVLVLGITGIAVSLLFVLTLDRDALFFNMFTIPGNCPLVEDPGGGHTKVSLNSLGYLLSPLRRSFAIIAGCLPILKLNISL